MSENLNFNDALNTLEVFKQLCVAEVSIPSLNKKIKIKELSAKQQKQLLSTAVQSAAEFKSFFVKEFYDILLQNSSETKEIINSLNFVEYTAIVLALRKQTSEEVVVNFTGENKEQILEKINLNDILNKIYSIKLPPIQNISANKDGVEIAIFLKIPTILDDVTFLEYLPSIKKQESETENLKQLIAETYMYESAKCIDKVTISGKDLGYNNLTVKQKYALVEKLPASLIQQLLTQYGSWKSEVNKVLRIQSSKGMEKQLDLESILFLTS